MRTVSSCIVVILGLTSTGCHPRLSGSDDQLTSPGTGGSGSLDTIRLKVIAAIAAGDYQHARELLELAAGLEEAERERLEQMISAAERGPAPFLEGALPHIFRDKPGHFPQDTAQVRNGKIINAGINTVPESAQRLLRQGGDR